MLLCFCRLTTAGLCTCKFYLCTCFWYEYTKSRKGYNILMSIIVDFLSKSWLLRFNGPANGIQHYDRMCTGTSFFLSRMLQKLDPRASFYSAFVACLFVCFFSCREALQWALEETISLFHIQHNPPRPAWISHLLICVMIQQSASLELEQENLSRKHENLIFYCSYVDFYNFCLGLLILHRHILLCYIFSVCCV